MTYSMTSPLSSYDDQVSNDHAFQAWEAIRRAQRVTWSVAHAQGWRADFRRHVSEARDRVVAHHEASRAPDSPLSRFIATCGDETRLAREHLAEHRWLRERLNELIRAVEARSTATIEDVVELTERAIFLEIQLARHQNRFRGLLRQGRSPSEAVATAGATESALR